MSRIRTSNTGSAASTLGTSWTHVAKRDTTNEAEAVGLTWWLDLSGADRAAWWMTRTRLFDELRYNVIRQRHPGASDAELTALWTEETYRETVASDFLAKVVAAIRTRPQG